MKKIGILILMYLFGVVLFYMGLMNAKDFYSKFFPMFFGGLLLALAIYFSIYPDKLALRSYEDPDRHPFQDIPGQEIIPGEQLYA